MEIDYITYWGFRHADRKSDGGSWWRSGCVLQLYNKNLSGIHSCCLESVRCNYCDGTAYEHLRPKFKCLYGTRHFMPADIYGRIGIPVDLPFKNFLRELMRSYPNE